MTTYRFQVFAENGVSLLAGNPEYVDITVTTEASVPNLVSNVRITSVKSTELSISWDAPVTEIGGDSDLVERYEGEMIHLPIIFIQFIVTTIPMYHSPMLF